MLLLFAPFLLLTDNCPPAKQDMNGTPKYWTLSTTPPPTPALKGMQWLYTNYCRRLWETVDQVIAQSTSGLPNNLQQCLHQTLSYQERKALKSDVLWLLIEQTGATVDLELDSIEVLDRTTLIQATVRLDAIKKVL
jgi:hypothetical protein